MSVLAVYLSAAFALLVGAYVTFRVIVRRDYLHRGRLTPFSMLLELLICGLYFNFPYTYAWSDWPALPALPDNTVLRVTGLIPVTVGLAVGVAGMVSLGLRRLFGMEASALKESGLYGISRNPQIVAFALVVIGCAVLWPSWYALGWVALYGLVFHMMVLTEEEYLRKLHGEAYARYCERVPRYVGFPR